MHEVSKSSDRPRRADAQRNLDTIVRAAREVFDQSGYATSIAEVAQRSGLGMGTVYRHFPNKALLMHHIAVSVMRELSGLVETALAAEADPWEAFRGVFLHMGRVRSSQLFPTSRGGDGPGLVELVEARTELLEALAELVERVQVSGDMRSDVTVHDVVIVLNAVPPHATDGESPRVDNASRHLRLLLDGFRAPGRETLDGPAPSRQDVDDFFRTTFDL